MVDLILSLLHELFALWTVPSLRQARGTCLREGIREQILLTEATGVTTELCCHHRGIVELSLELGQRVLT